MTNGVSSIVCGVAIALISAAGVGGFNLYTDVQLLKAHSHSTDAALRANHEAGQEFMKTLSQINATLAAQTEAINNLKEAVRRNDPTAPISYLTKKDFNYDRRD